MKSVTAGLLGLCVILVFQNSVIIRAKHVHKGTKGGITLLGLVCREYMEDPTEEQKKMFDDCWDWEGKSTQTENSIDNKEDKMTKTKLMHKITKCLLKKTKILVDNKFKIENFNADIDFQFSDGTKGALVKKEAAACVPDPNKEYKTDEENVTLMKCILKAFDTSCKDADS